MPSKIKMIEIRLDEINRPKYAKYIKKLDDWGLRDALVKTDSIVYFEKCRGKKHEN